MECIAIQLIFSLIMDSYMDKEVQRDKKLVSYAIVDKAGKPYISVDIAGENKVIKTSTAAVFLNFWVMEKDLIP